METKRKEVLKDVKKALGKDKVLIISVGMNENENKEDGDKGMITYIDKMNLVEVIGLIETLKLKFFKDRTNPFNDLMTSLDKDMETMLADAKSRLKKNGRRSNNNKSAK